MSGNRIELDARGFKCPTPTLKMTNFVMSNKVQKGDTFVVLADCDTFEKDVRQWCETFHKVLIVFRHDGPVQHAEIRM